MTIYTPHLFSIPFKSELCLNRYIRFIEACLEKNKNLSPDVYTEKHHILPKADSMFPQFTDLRQNPWNKAILTARQHLIAHLLLWKAYDNAPMIHAGQMMVNFHGTGMGSRLYGKLREAHAAAMSALHKGKQGKLQTEETKTKRNQSCLERFGVENAFQSPEIQERQKRTMQELYGVENAFQSPEIQERQKRTMQERYGVEYAVQSPEVQENFKQTCLERYGVEHPMQNLEVQENFKQTNLERYGFEYATQTPEARAKTGMLNKEKVSREMVAKIKELSQKVGVKMWGSGWMRARDDRLERIYRLLRLFETNQAMDGTIVDRTQIALVA